VSENLISASPGTIGGPIWIIPARTGAFRHENGNPRLAAHLPGASDAGLL
jgi:hypothetical protein